MDSSNAKSLSVFLCHASQDKAFVRSFYKKLREKGMKPWLDEEDLLPGQNWQVEIKRAVKHSDAVVVCLSKQSVTKVGFVQKEIKYALDIADEQPEGTIFLIPARIEDCDIPERLSHLQSPKIYEEKGYQSLINSLKIRATFLGRHLIQPTQGAENAEDNPLGDKFVSDTAPPDLIGSCFREAFSETYWDRHPHLSLKSKKSFTVSLVGKAGVGKTSLTYILSGASFNLLGTSGIATQQHAYRFLLQDRIYITDHLSWEADPKIWNNALSYLNKSSDLIFFVFDLRTRIDIESRQALEMVKQSDTPVVILCNKVDLLTSKELPFYLQKIKGELGQTPLPVAAAGGIGIDSLKKFILKARQMYL